jgi:hypothetical protein
VVDDELALFLAHESIECAPAASAATALHHLDEPRTRVFLGDGSSDDKINNWFLDSGATHHMTKRQEFFSDLDTDVRGSVKFGDSSGVDIKGIGSLVLVAKTGGHRLLTQVFNILALRNSIIGLGRLDESDSRMEINDEVLCIWDQQQHLLVNAARGSDYLYVLHAEVRQPPCLRLVVTTKLGGGASTSNTSIPGFAAARHQGDGAGHVTRGPRRATLRHLRHDEAEATSLPSPGKLPSQRVARARARRPLRTVDASHARRTTLLPTTCRRRLHLQVEERDFQLDFDRLGFGPLISLSLTTLTLTFDCPIREWKLIHGFAWKTALPLFKLGRSRKHT